MPALKSTTPETYGDLKRLLARSPRGDWPSRNNPGMTHSQALDVLSAAVDQYDDTARIRDDRRGDIMMRNVLREVRTRDY